MRCWFAPEDLKIGEGFRIRIDESIRLYDKLLLVLSKGSVESQWVENEVETAFEKEQEQKQMMLFPVRLDDAVTEIKTGSAADVRRSRHTGGFRDWKKASGGACLTIVGGELKLKSNLLLYKFTRQRRPGAGRMERLESAEPSFV